MTLMFGPADSSSPCRLRFYDNLQQEFWFGKAPSPTLCKCAFFYPGRAKCYSDIAASGFIEMSAPTSEYAQHAQHIDEVNVNVWHSRQPSDSGQNLDCKPENWSCAITQWSKAFLAVEDLSVKKLCSKITVPFSRHFYFCPLRGEFSHKTTIHS